MQVLFFTLVFFVFSGIATASSYSACHIMGVVEDVFFNKINFRPLKSENTNLKNYDINYHNCSEMQGTVIALYDKSEDAANEPCTFKVKTGFYHKKIRSKWKDNVQKGDMLTFDYSFYQSMTPSGGLCVKDWVLKNHVPLNPHSR